MSGGFSRIESPDLSLLTVSKLLSEQAYFLPQFAYFSPCYELPGVACKNPEREINLGLQT